MGTTNNSSLPLSEYETDKHSLLFTFEVIKSTSTTLD